MSENQDINSRHSMSDGGSSSIIDEGQHDQDQVLKNPFQSSKSTPPDQPVPDSMTTPPQADNVFTSPSQRNEDESLAFINEQLSFLNEASGELATTIHRSNKQVRQDIAKKSRDSGMRRRELYKSPAKRFAQIQGRGVKRSPGKLALNRPKVARQSLEVQSVSDQVNMLDDEDGANDEDESSDDDNTWTILEESDTDAPINEALEENVLRSNLTASNVKKLLHQVITNEHVVAMVKNTLLAENEKSEAHYEPKMTRSKVKHIIQEEGDVLHPWPLSPLKKSKPPGASFLEVEFSDDEEEDDEYDPSKEPDPVSDEDTESMTSSQVSDTGSPAPSTPRTPRSCDRLSDFNITPSNRDGWSPMGPPSQKHLLGRKYQEAMAAADKTEEETIALRTRSKLSLTETTLTELESTFVAPDITADMYDTQCDDNDWQTFLTSLVKPCETEDTNDGGEEEDPEYNYLEDAAKSEVDREDLRSDRAVQVSKREMNQLMDELFDVYEDMELEEAEKQKMKKLARNNLIKSHKKQRQVATVVTSSAPGALKMTESERLQVEDQMRKHVQLLSQMYVLSQSSQETHGSLAADCVFLLKEIKCFASSSSLVTPDRRSAFYAHNLDGALRMVTETKDWGQSQPPEGRLPSPEKSLTSLLAKHYTNLSSRQKDRILEVVDSDQRGRDLNDPATLPTSKSTLPVLTRQQKETIWNLDVFFCFNLLPVGGFDLSVPKVKQRITFTEAEDNLLALGYDQFSSFPLHRELIQKFLLPCKTPDQIKIRIKNLSASKIGDNVIKQLKRTKQLPEFPQYGLDWDESLMKAPKDQLINRDFPYWCKEMRIKEIIGTSGEVTVSDVTLDGTMVGRKRRARSVNLPIRMKEIKSKVKKTRSAPTTPADPDLVDSLSMSAILSKTQDTSLDTEFKLQSRDIIMVNSPQPLWKKSLQQGARNSPVSGFISLDKCSGIDNEGQPASPINIRILDSVPSPARIQNVASPAHSTLSNPGTPNSHQGVQEQTTPHKSDPVRALPVSPIVIVQGKPPVTCAKPTFLVVNSVGSVSVAGQRITPVKTVSCRDRVVPSVLETSATGILGIPPKTTETLSNITEVSLSGGGKLIITPPKKDSLQDGSLKSNQSSIDSPTTIVSPSGPLGQSTPENIHSSQKSQAKANGNVTPENVRQSEESPAKSALEIVASYAPFIYSPLKSDTLSPEKFSELNQLSQERTPTKSSAFVPRYRPVAPNPFFSSPTKTVSPFLGKDKSPRRKQLAKKAQAICPKGFVLKSYVSPSKKAATNIVHRVLKRNVPKILPRNSPRSELQIKIRSPDSSKKKSSQFCDEEKGEYDLMESEDLSDDDGVNSEKMRGKIGRSGNKSNQKSRQKVTRPESDDTQSENEDGNDLYDSQNDEEEDLDDEDHMAELMAASSRIGFAQKKGGLKDKNRSKAQKRKDSALAMLAPDLLNTDPQKDDRDTAFAQAYLCRAREVLKTDDDTYEAFLKLLYDFGKSDFSPVKLYKELRVVLKEYPDLVTDFAGFLLPEQAVECGCYMTTQEFVRARTFLRKLEVHFLRHPTHFQKCLKVLSSWSQKHNKSAAELKVALEPLLKGQIHLLQELSLFFKDEHPPESYLTDYEEITLGESDEEADFDGFEEVELPDEEDISGTKKCQCRCHNNPVDTNYFKRNKHCYSCCLKVIDGELFYRVNTKTLKKVKVIFHKPIKARSIQKEEVKDAERNSDNREWYEDDTAAAEKENMDISLLEEQPRTKSMSKMKISLKKKAKGRFMTLNEMAESPQKGSISGSPRSEAQRSVTPNKELTCQATTSNKGTGQRRGVATSLFGVRDETSSTSQRKDTSSQDLPVTGTSAIPDQRQADPRSLCEGQEHSKDYIAVQGNVTLPVQSAQILESSSTRLLVQTVQASESSGPSLPVQVAQTSDSTSIVVPVKASDKSSQNQTFQGNGTDAGIRHLSMETKTSTASGLSVSPHTYCEDTSQKSSSLSSSLPMNLDFMTEDASLSPQKRLTPAVNLLRHAGEFGSPSKDSTCSDILAKAVKVAMIGQGDVTMDTTLMDSRSNTRGSSSILAKAFNEAMIGQGDSSVDCSFLTTSTSASRPNLTVELSSSRAFSMVSCPKPENSQETGQLLHPGATGPLDRSDVQTDNKLREGFRGCVREVDVAMESVRNDQFRHADSVGQPLTSRHCEASMDSQSVVDVVNVSTPQLDTSQVSSPSTTEPDKADSVKTNMSCVSSSDEGSRSQDWSKETDRKILEHVKECGTSPETFDELAKQLGNKTGSQVLKRFQHMLELLAQETASDNDTSSSSRSSELL